jgi:Metallo-beta-lactamase superfamily
MAPMMEQAADGVWLVTGTDVNWVLVADGDQVTLVDTGEPRDLPRVRSALEAIRRALGDVSAVVLTHAHPDHIGSAEWLRAERGIPVRLLDTEAPHARGEIIEEASKLQVLRAAWRPQVLLWALRIMRPGATRVERLTEVKPFELGAGPLDVPGAPGAGPDSRPHQWALCLPPASARRSHRRRCPDNRAPGRARDRPPAVSPDIQPRSGGRAGLAPCAGRALRGRGAAGARPGLPRQSSQRCRASPGYAPLNTTALTGRQ